MPFPLLTTGSVRAHDPDNHGVYVTLKSGESPMLSVRVGTHGPADALRINHAELPGRGTMGLIAFPHGDARNGVWLASYPANCLDAFTAAPSETAVRYASHLSGHWKYLGQDGSSTEMWPDGSSLVVGNGGVPAVTHRHILDQNGARVRSVLTQAQRVPSPPAPFPRVFTHASGAVESIFATGAFATTAAAGQMINISALGDAVLHLVDERMVTAFNNHTHPANNAVPAQQITVVTTVTTTHLHGG
jgi:hypothetical protein